MPETQVPDAVVENDPCAAHRELDSDLGWGLGVVFRAYVRSTAAALDELPGGPRGYQVVKSAAKDQPASQLALAQQLGVDRTVMTYLIDDLVAAGLVTREPDPADRRARRVVATARGHAELDRLDARLKQVESHVLTGLEADEIAAFRSLVMRLAVRIDKLDPVTNTCTIVEEVGSADGAC